MILCFAVLLAVAATVLMFLAAARAGTRDWTSADWDVAYSIHAKIAKENAR